MDMGGYVIIINAEKVTVTGNKFNDKLYRSHPTAKPGTLKTETFRQLNEVRAHHGPCTLLHSVPSSSIGDLFHYALLHAKSDLILK